MAPTMTQSGNGIRTNVDIERTGHTQNRARFDYVQPIS
ncbi:hypothetical protein GGD56_003204 [Rhizobium mongolense]|uniref:Uncharacterized protein n=1 Tax=Rhizobium mongolense TaxID=57676 RepID=A0ABR6IP38_9HYPH|nr:hypothetical protein [Rhizobium mongolense]